MKYIVESWVNGRISDGWEFEDKEKSLEFYREKAHNLNKERIEENRQANIKFDNDDEWGYSWHDEDWEESLEAFKTWRGVKEETRSLWNED